MKSFLCTAARAVEPVDPYVGVHRRAVGPVAKVAVDIVVVVVAIAVDAVVRHCLLDLGRGFHHWSSAQVEGTH